LLVLFFLIHCDIPSEQAVIQIGLATYRLVAFTIMIITVGIALFQPNPFSAVPQDSAPYTAFTSEVKWGGFSSIFSSSVVALTFHYCIPDLIGSK
jgi:hypothetical protein